MDHGVTSCDLWHSTPVKTGTNILGAPIEEPSPVSTPSQRDGQWMVRQSPGNGLSSTGSHYTRTPSFSLPLLQDRQSLGEMENAIILRQRHELQLLIADLKDRDQELNTMAAAHHKQVTAWEQDRQRVLTLEQRCARLEDELKKRNDVIRAVTKRVHVVEAREKEGQREHTFTLQQMLELGQKHQNAIQHCHDLEEKIHSLNPTVTSLSAQLGSLQVREEELRAILRLKDTDVTEATNHILDLSGHVQEMEGSLKESRLREAKALKELEERKRQYKDLRHDNTRLQEELEQLVAEGSAQREDVIRLKQEGQLLRRELAMSDEGQSWKDELLGLARSKQERTESELRCLRQVCEHQQNDLQLLKLNLESTREALTQAEGQVLPSSQGELTCVHLGSPSPSQSRRSSGHKDSGSPAIGHQQCVVSGNLGDVLTVLEDEDQFSSTNHLQRLLAESRQMVASLERTTLKPLNPSHSSASNVSCENPDNQNPFNPSKPCQYLNETTPPARTTRSSQTRYWGCDTPPRNTQAFQRNQEGQWGVGHPPEHSGLPEESGRAMGGGSPT